MCEEALHQVEPLFYFEFVQPSSICIKQVAFLLLTSCVVFQPETAAFCHMEIQWLHFLSWEEKSAFGK